MFDHFDATVSVEEMYNDDFVPTQEDWEEAMNYFDTLENDYPSIV